MALADSLLSAIVRADGDALVMHVGERPYVVVGKSPLHISTHDLNLDTTITMMSQLLPAEALATLEEFGAVEHRLQDVDADRFNIVAARGGDDIWIEIRRRRGQSEAAVADAEVQRREGEAAEEQRRLSAALAAQEEARKAEEAARAEEQRRLEEAARAEEQRRAEEAARAEEQRRVEEAARAEEQRRAEEAARAEEQRRAEEAARAEEQRRAEEAARAEEQRRAEEAARAEEQRRAEEAARAEEQRRAEEAARAEEQRRAEEAARAEEQRRAEEAARAEEQRRAEEAARAEEQRRAEEAARAEEQRRAEEAARAEEQRRAEEAARAEEQRRAEEAARAEEQRRAEEAARAEEQRRAEEAARAEEQRRAEEAARAEEERRAAEAAAEERRLAEQAAAAAAAEAEERRVADEQRRLAAIAASAAAADEERRRAAEAAANDDGIRVSPPALAAEPEPLRSQPLEQLEPLELLEAAASVVVPMTRTVRIEVPPRGSALRTTDIERLLRVVAARGASALFLTSESRPYMRVDGDIRLLDNEPVLSRTDVEAAIVEIAPENGREQFGKGQVAEWLKEYPELGRIRCTTFSDHRGPGLLLRMIATRPATVEQLGLSREVQALATESQGLVLVAGPRASGKSTLMSALVDQVNRQRAEFVITLERQIRLVHDNKSALVSQREIRGGADEALAAARSALREGPDVLVIDDLISAQMVPLILTAASEGLLVFVSMAAPSTTDAVQRFIELAAPEMRSAVQTAMTESFRGAVAQVMLKKTGGGLVTAREVLLATAPVSRVIAEGQLAQLPHVLESGRKHGMVSFSETLVEYVRSGTVDVREAFRKAPDRERLLAGLKREKIDTSLVERLA